eukprot:scaffold200109_cov19-Tisochrysis_lutea.AAC.1
MDAPAHTDIGNGASFALDTLALTAGPALQRKGKDRKRKGYAAVLPTNAAGPALLINAPMQPLGLQEGQQLHSTVAPL